MALEWVEMFPSQQTPGLSFPGKLMAALATALVKMKCELRSSNRLRLRTPINLICAISRDCEIRWLNIKVWQDPPRMLMHWWGTAAEQKRRQTTRIGALVVNMLAKFSLTEEKKKTCCHPVVAAFPALFNTAIPTTKGWIYLDLYPCALCLMPYLYFKVQHYRRRAAWTVSSPPLCLIVPIL